MIKIELTKEEYRHLLTVLFLADWMISSTAGGRTNKDDEHEQLREKILSYYQVMEAEDYILYDEKTDQYYETADFEDDLQESYILPFEDNNFWHELIDRLAERDVVNGMGLDAYLKLESEERLQKLTVAKKCYAREFEENGIDNISIKNINCQ